MTLEGIVDDRTIYCICPESLVIFLHIRGTAVARQCVFNLIFYNLIIYTARLSNWIMYLSYFTSVFVVI